MKPDENTKLMSVNQKFERRYVPIFAINIVLWTVMLNRSSPAGREINYRFVGVHWASYMFVVRTSLPIKLSFYPGILTVISMCDISP